MALVIERRLKIKIEISKIKRSNKLLRLREVIKFQLQQFFIREFFTFPWSHDFQHRFFSLVESPPPPPPCTM